MRLADTSLSPSEREDKESDRLLNRKPAPSRKNKDRRAPRHDQRRRRIRDDDPDFRKPRKDRGGSWKSKLPSKSDLQVENLDETLRSIDSYLGEDFDETASFDELLEALGDVGVDIEDLEKIAEKVRTKPQDEAYDYVAELLKLSDFDPKKMQELDLPKKTGSEASNGDFLSMPRTGAYHGIRDVRGNPTDPPNTDYKSYDKRYFTDKDYDVIVKTASKFLDSDWLKYSWEDGAKDAPLRAALDLSIHTANNCLYQSKIDTETYDLLLNRLAKWGYETFSDTVLPMKAPSGDKRTSSMTIKTSEEYKSIVRVANELREENPVAALNILKSLRSLVSSESEPVQTISEHIAVTEEAPAPAAEPVVRSASVVATAEVPLSVLCQVAVSSDSAKAALGPFILAAKKSKKDDKKDDTTAAPKKELPPEFLKNKKPKGKGKGKKKRKASIVLDDSKW